jgi:hypothetical protein
MSDKIQVIFYPGVNKNELEEGTCSEISWQRMSDHLDKDYTQSTNPDLLIDLNNPTTNQTKKEND